VCRWLVGWQIASQRFTTEPQGIPGNDDYGAMSAWLVWTSIGLYPITGTGGWALGLPRFRNTTVKRPRGDWTITCTCCDEEREDYDGIVTVVNGRVIESGYLPHDMLLGPTTVHLECK
jgi:putative alpha-1,2-mannosidase